MKSSSRVRLLDISQNDIGSENFPILLPIFESNGYIEDLNLADTNIDGTCTELLCKILKKQNKAIKQIKFRNSNLGDIGAKALADLICTNMTLVDLEIYNCDIDEKGGHAIGNALTTNFCLNTLNIGGNILDNHDVEQIQQSVTFNTQYHQVKDSH